MPSAIPETVSSSGEEDEMSSTSDPIPSDNPRAQYETLSDSDEDDDMGMNRINPFASTSTPCAARASTPNISNRMNNKQNFGDLADFDPLSPSRQLSIPHSSGRTTQQQQAIRHSGASSSTSSAFSTSSIRSSLHSPTQGSLLDTTTDMDPTTAFIEAQKQQSSSSQQRMAVRMTSNASTPGVAGFLEMEEEPSRHSAEQILETQDDLIDFTPPDEPIQTSSGLLLTHRKSTFEKRANKSPYYRPPTNESRFEMEGPRVAHRQHHGSGGFGRAPYGIIQARRWLSLAKLWVVFFCAVLVIGTGVMIHSFRHEDTNNSSSSSNELGSLTVSSQQQQQRYTDEQAVPEQILLLPLNNASELARQQREAEQQFNHRRRLLTTQPSEPLHLPHMESLRQEFEAWIRTHNKQYKSHHEKEHRFSIWRDNHQRTKAKNERHGPCRMTGKPVFGSNHLKDLTPSEFQQMLSGYNGPTADHVEVKTGRRRRMTERPAGSGHTFTANFEVHRHPEVQRRLEEHWHLNGFTLRSSNCQWYDVSCWLRFFFIEYLYIGTGTMEPMYDSETYPLAVDWRDMGAVTEVRTQGDCGGCYAVTAIETVESAYFISTGSLVDLSEAEVIACTDTCNMCYGGWPQDAYDYVMEHKGVLPASSFAYDADTLLAVSEELVAGDDGTLDEDLFEQYRNEVCPASGSGDNDDGQTRYGNIKGYGFATDRCTCYTDGSGCDCDEQNEGLAVRNVASYGPATVCLDASVWQDYDGGILTSSSGCSAEFLAMNHCVQVVGYAFNEVNGDGEGSNDGSGSGSNSRDSGSGDSSQREGYWIVRNQWSNAWGMNGYAYVAMGDNTCGILNDMTQVYF